MTHDFPSDTRLTAEQAARYPAPAGMARTQHVGVMLFGRERVDRRAAARRILADVNAQTAAWGVRRVPGTAKLLTMQQVHGPDFYRPHAQHGVFDPAYDEPIRRADAPDEYVIEFEVAAR